MNKTQIGYYCEFESSLVDSTLDFDQVMLRNAAYESAVHTFGWPIAPVLINNPEYEPKPDESGIEVTIDDEETRYDYWRLKRNGDFHILKSLFEDQRSKNKIFFDTRTIRTSETFYRTALLYKALGIPDERMKCSIEYGGLKGRVLTVASQNRIMIPKTCTGNLVKKEFEESVTRFLDIEFLKSITYDVIKAICIMCDYFEPDVSVTNQIVEDYLLKHRVS
jgi:hypothetical protein